MKRLAVVGLVALAALPLFNAGAAIPETGAVAKGAAFIISNFSADGSYGGPSAGENFDGIYAIRAAGFDPAKDVAASGASPVGYLEANAAAQTKPAEAAKAALAAKALGIDPTAVQGTNLIAAINAGFDPAKGTYAADDFSQSIAMLGLACTGNTVPALAVTELKSTQLADGGWGFGGSSDPDTTAIATQALLAAGVPNTDVAITNAVAWFKTNQLPDGGWGFAPASNTSSTAYVVQALVAAGQSLNIPQYVQAGASPVSYLLSQQDADGSFKGYDALYATFQVLPALAGRTFCNAAATPITQPAPAGPLAAKPVVTPTPTTTPSATPPATASPTVSVTPAGPSPSSTPPASSPTAAPRPPSTGSGSEPGGAPLSTILVGMALLLATAAAAAVSLRHER